MGRPTADVRRQIGVSSSRPIRPWLWAWRFRARDEIRVGSDLALCPRPQTLPDRVEQRPQPSTGMGEECPDEHAVPIDGLGAARSARGWSGLSLFGLTSDMKN